MSAELQGHLVNSLPGPDAKPFSEVAGTLKEVIPLQEIKKKNQSPLFRKLNFMFAKAEVSRSMLREYEVHLF